VALHSPNDQLFNAVGKPAIPRGRLLKARHVIMVVAVLKRLVSITVGQQHFRRRENRQERHVTKVYTHFTGRDDKDRRRCSLALSAIAVQSNFLLTSVSEKAILAYNLCLAVAVYHILQQIRVNFGNVLKDSSLRIKPGRPCREGGIGHVTGSTKGHIGHVTGSTKGHIGHVTGSTKKLFQDAKKVI